MAVYNRTNHLCTYIYNCIKWTQTSEQKLKTKLLIGAPIYLFGNWNKYRMENLWKDQEKKIILNFTKL